MRNTLRAIAACALIISALTSATGASGGTGQSFMSLAPTYNQKLVGVTQMPDFPDGLPMVLGGIAFAPGGDLWVADCVFANTRLHRFALSQPPITPAVHGTATLHQEIATVSTQGGCGLTNWANPAAGLAALYSNSSQGVYELNASTGAVMRGPLGPAGNGLGIAVDPQTNHVVYAGADCHPRLIDPEPATCTLWDLDPAAANGSPTKWAQTTHAAMPFIDGMYFDPTGNHLFVANRVEENVTNYLTVLKRPTTPLAGNAQIAQNVTMTAEPDGVAFHDASDPFVLTNDEFDFATGLGTMTRFNFPSGFEAAPGPSATPDPSLFPYETRFAGGGFRGDLTQVGPDGCIYATQGRFFSDDGFGGLGNGTRYDDLTETPEDGIVQICGDSGGFVAPAGVTDTVNGGGATLGSIAGLVYFDANHNGTRDAGEAGLGGVTVTLSNSQTAASAADGAFLFENVPAETYVVTAPTTASYLSGSIAISTAASAGPFALAAGENKTGLEFGYAPGALAGVVFRDSNGNGVREAGEPALPGVTVTLSGAGSGTAVSQADGSYSFGQLASGAYTVTAPPSASGLALSTTSPLHPNLNPGATITGLDFGYKPGSLAGTVFRDSNGNGTREAGEPALSGVTVTLSGAGSGTAVSQANGSYSFSDLGAGNYVVTVPATASGLALSTASPLNPVLASGESKTGLDFGYKPGSLAGTVFRDTNGNGTREAGEPALPGVTVTLSGDGFGTAVSQANGSYSFSDLGAGNYVVTVPATASGLALSTASPLNPALASGESKTGLDFGYKPGSLAGTVFRDTNGNGTREAGEPALPGVTVTLSGDGSGTAVSQANGSYSFSDLGAGNYVVTVPATASGLALSTASPLSPSLGAGMNRTSLDFGYKPGSIAGTVFRDTNGNGTREAGEPALPGVTVTLSGAGSGTAVSQANGSYSFNDLGAGNYSVTVPATASGLALSTPSPLNTSLGAGVNRTGLDFGYKPGALSGYAYVDANHNNIKDSGEAIIPGVPISGPGGTATTQADGSYSFSNLNAGTYSVSAPAMAGGLSLGTPSPLSVGVAAGQLSPNNNFGYAGSTITGTVFTDTNGNGTKESSEPPLTGVTVTLTGPNGTTTTTTDSNGNFTFPNLPPGTYTVTVPPTVGGGTTQTTTRTVTVTGGNSGTTSFGYTPAAAFLTYTQGGWGAGPAGNNPGMLLKNNFATVYPNGVTIGGSPYYLKFTSQPAIEAFLPAGGKPGVLNKSATNPTSSSANVFAGQVLALQLSVDFSKAGITTAGLTAQKIAPGNTLAGQTVQQILTLANQVLAGNTSALPSGVSVSTLNDILSRINQNYDGGTTNGGYLVP